MKGYQSLVMLDFRIGTSIFQSAAPFYNHTQTIEVLRNNMPNMPSSTKNVANENASSRARVLLKQSIETTIL